MTEASARRRLLVLWNQTEEDVYEKWRAEGPRALPWDPSTTVPDVGTVREELDAIVQGLAGQGYEVRVVNVHDDLDRLMGAVREFRPDAVFNLIEYFQDDPAYESHVAGLFELMGISYTGSRPTTLSLCQNKYRTKLLLEAAGLPTPDFFIVVKGAAPRDHDLEFPLIVKPAYEDASGGIEPASVVQDQEALEERVGYVIKEFGMPALVEEYIEGREIHAAVLGNDPPEVLPLFEMVFDDAEFNPQREWRPQIISFRAKWDPHSPEFYSMDAVVPPEDLDDKVAQEIRAIALEAFQATRCRDYARIDMRLADDGQPFILEVNPNPDLTDGAAFMMCAVQGGRTFPQTLAFIAEQAIGRGKREKTDPGESKLPSDELLREYELSKRAKSES